MRHTISNFTEMLLGAIIFGFGLLYLSSQEKTVDRLIDVANERVMEMGGLDQKHNGIDWDHVSTEELYAVVMGYREYPITIDENVIPPYGNDYEEYFELIRDGNYTKRYVYDTQRTLIRIEFMYSGA